jgi:hypothetical protein
MLEFVWAQGKIMVAGRIEELAGFLGATEITYNRRVPSIWKDGLR